MLAVANFHYIRKQFKSKYPSIFGLTPDQFRKQLKELSKYGIFVSQQEIIEGIPEAKKAILITFDDGLKEQFEVARPILQEMKIPFVCFVNTSNFTEGKVSLVHQIHLLRSLIAPAQLQKKIKEQAAIGLSEEEKNKALTHYNYDENEVAKLKYLLNFKINSSKLEKIITPLFTEYFNEKETASEIYMSQKQLLELWSENSLGSHGHRHDPLGLLSTEKVKYDLEKSQEFFVNNFGGKAQSFSFPYGSFEACKGLSQILLSCGFKLAFSMERAVNKNSSANALLLARYDCNDLPGGKNNVFERKNLFKGPNFSKWHVYENRTTNK